MIFGYRLVRGRQKLANFALALALAVAVGGCSGGSSGDGGSNAASGSPKHLCPALFQLAQSDVSGEPAAVDLSTCNKDSNGNIIIGSGSGQCGPNVLINKSFTGSGALGTITVASGGVLGYPTTIKSQMQLETAGIIVQSGGTFSIGTSACPVTPIAGLSGPTVTVTFTGQGAAQGEKGIDVQGGGRLIMYGTKGAPATGSVTTDGVSWTHLLNPAGPSSYGANSGTLVPVTTDANTITVKGQVDWSSGDWIAVGTTNYVADDTEFVQIADAPTYDSGSDTTTIKLSALTPLKFYHFGGADPGLAADPGNLGKPSASFSDPAEKNYGVDERAEVALISRAIKLTAQTPSPRDGSGHLINPQPPGLHGGGEIDINASATAAIQGVEIEKFGKGGVAGSYPIDFAGQPASAIINSNTIHHSFNHGIALNGASNLTIQNNVVARAVGHLFYLVSGTEVSDTFSGNLGMGAMMNNYPAPTDATQFWGGDYLAYANGYDGFSIPYSDPPNQIGAAGIEQSPACGFWLSNISANLTGNSIAGVQGVGTGYQYIPYVASQPQVGPIGAFLNNSVHAAYLGLGTAAGGANNPGDWRGDGLIPIKCTGGTPGAMCPGPNQGQHLLSTFEGFTATRNRQLGAWVRPGFYVFDNARFAGNREALSIVSGGGSEGVIPGGWGLVENSVFVGISQNNPDRWGPCPQKNGQGCIGDTAGGNGYPPPSWPMFGYMFYDGPARVGNDHFVNFIEDQSAGLPTFKQFLTNDDYQFLVNYLSTNNIKYEGDAAIGWMQSNVNVYPPSQCVNNVTFQNASFRHRVYTSSVNQGNFLDGDKFTVVLDMDGSLSGYKVIPGATCPQGQTCDKPPVSLNNLPFVGIGGLDQSNQPLPEDSVDECEATGPLDLDLEGRPSAMISAQDYATLEANILTPGNGYLRQDNITPCPCAGNNTGVECNGNAAITSDPASPNCNWLTVEKDQIDFPGIAQHDTEFIASGQNQLAQAQTITCSADHSCVSLQGRNQQGVYEPKVINGLGFTIDAAQHPLPSFLDLGFADANVTGGISAGNPFKIRMGLCYKTTSGTAPASASAFTVKVGRKSLGATNTGAPFSYNAVTLYRQLPCFNLDFTQGSNYLVNCPSVPNGTGGYMQQTQSFTTMNVTAATMPATLAPNTAYYDASAGMLFFDMIETEPAADGPSPLGDCPGAVGCPEAGETFYSCPADGCILYTVQADSSYQPSGATACTPYAATLGTNSYGLGGYTLPYPSGMNQLAYKSDGTAVSIKNATNSLAAMFPHIEDNNEASLCQ
jgi:hypothetical protein